MRVDQVRLQDVVWVARTADAISLDEIERIVI